MRPAAVPLLAILALPSQTTAQTVRTRSTGTPGPSRGGFAVGEHDDSWFGWRILRAGDVDGDGLHDLLVTSPGFGHRSKGKVYLYTGADGLGSTPTWSAESPFPPQGGWGSAFGWSAAEVGDVDGDGCDDLLVGSWRGGAAWYSGRTLRAGQAPDWTATTPPGSEGFSVGAAGDTNRDGYPDLLLCTTGEARLHLGGPGGPSDLPAMTISPIPGYEVPVVSEVGDVDGDGFTDVAVEGEYYLAIHRGSASGLSPTPASTGVWGGSRWFQVGGVGDVNGDGHADLYESAWDDGWVMPVLLGGVGASLSYSQASWVGCRPGEVLPMGDAVGQDGFDDILTIFPDYYPSYGLAAVYPGSATGPSWLSRQSLDIALPPGLPCDQEGGFWEGALLDMDGDGSQDLVLGSIGFQTNLRTNPLTPGGVFFYRGPDWKPSGWMLPR